jgi:uncharacterized protein (TIGR00255 family)
MTGFGDARGQNDRLCVSIEVRSVNNRYFKLATKIPERYQPLDAEIERVVRESISRGTVNLALRVDGVGGEFGYHLDGPVLESYFKQLKTLNTQLGGEAAVDLGSLLMLPGVISEGDMAAGNPREGWPLIESTLRQALVHLRDFRIAEGASMEKDLRTNLGTVAMELEKVAGLAPQIVRDFRDRMHERVKELLREREATVTPADLIREVSIFAERCDINEEITRLRSHLDQFDSFVRQPQSEGRKLDFLSQEMVREVNTIGSKANNAQAAQAVVEIKAAIERIREVLQNVE